MYIVKRKKRVPDKRTGKYRVYRGPIFPWSHNVKKVIDPNQLKLCQGPCGLWKPLSKFRRSGDRKVERKIKLTKLCNVCRRAAVGKWLTEYYQSLKDDPIKMLEAIEKFDKLRPSPRNNIDGYWKWLKAKNSLLSRLGLIDKRPVNLYIVNYLNRQVLRGEITTREAEERLERFYERNPECRLSVDHSPRMVDSPKDS